MCFYYAFIALNKNSFSLVRPLLYYIVKEGDILSELLIDKKYYNALDIEGFSKMMNSPSYCYKFYWLEAIVQLISLNKTEATYEEVINKMITNAWYSVLEYHIHLSGIYGAGMIKDNLENAVIRLQKLSNLGSNTSSVEIQNALLEYANDRPLLDYKKTLTQYVPYRALSGFANRGKEKISLDSSSGQMMAYYNKLSSTEILLPYTFNEDKGLKRKILFNSSWIQMIQDNTVNILGWIQLEKVKWLQANNPEVPGLVYKLSAEDVKQRKLDNARKLWDAVLDIKPIVDVFKDEYIDEDKYDLDHFIPWSFVMNDELWNLMPMDSSWNSKKSNNLPKWDLFFNKFASNQYTLYELLYLPGIHKLYEACYRDNLHSIWANQELYRKGNTQEEFQNILDKNMRPVYDSARRQGYKIWNIE